jgi:hypothetical protein
VHYPADYGFIVDTLARDGDHLDVIVVEQPAVAGSMLSARSIGLLHMEDEKGPTRRSWPSPSVTRVSPTSTHSRICPGTGSSRSRSCSMPIRRSLHLVLVGIDVVLGGA